MASRSKSRENISIHFSTRFSLTTAIRSGSRKRAHCSSLWITSLSSVRHVSSVFWISYCSEMLSESRRTNSRTCSRNSAGIDASSNRQPFVSNVRSRPTTAPTSASETGRIPVHTT